MSGHSLKRTGTTICGAFFSPLSGYAQHVGGGSPCLFERSLTCRYVRCHSQGPARRALAPGLGILRTGGMFCRSACRVEPQSYRSISTRPIALISRTYVHYAYPDSEPMRFCCRRLGQGVGIACSTCIGLSCVHVASRQGVVTQVEGSRATRFELLFFCCAAELYSCV